MDELVGFAMVGTARRRPAWKDALLIHLSGPPEAQLWDAAALLGVSRLAGQRLSEGTGLPVDEARDERTEAPAGMLGRVLTEAPSLLGEWLELAESAGLRAPRILLPELLDRGKRDRALGSRLAQVGGARSLWLARQNSDWQYLLGESLDDEAWHHGKAAVRLEWLARLREREPARARVLLQSSWRQESADERTRLLASLAVGLTAEDEEFLENALDDRAQGVRREAARLLSRLEGSALGHRMEARAKRWLDTGGQARVNPPERCDATMQRDGIESAPPRGMGEKAWWLQQGLALAPLPPSPAGLLGAAAQGNWALPLVSGWLEAAINQRNVAWAEVLLNHGSTDERLFALLSPDRREERLLQLSRPSLSWLKLIRPYSRELALAVLSWIQRLARHPIDAEWIQALPDLAGAFSIDATIAVESGWPQDSPHWGRWRAAVERFIQRIEFRRAMHEEMRRADDAGGATMMREEIR